MQYRIDERVGCIAVVEGSFDGNCLYAEMDGVVAFWSGVYGDNGWEVSEWQKQKASRLCDLLNLVHPDPITREWSTPAEDEAWKNL